MNYRQLQKIISSFTEEQLNADVTIYTHDTLPADECFSVERGMYFVSDNTHLAGVLDDGHPYLIIKP